MTLVVAQIHDERITIVGDTKISDQRRGYDWANRHVYENAVPKIVRLRRDMAVSVAGDNPHESLRAVSGMRHLAPEDVVATLEKSDYGSFLVAALSPTVGLWRIQDGVVEDRTSVGRAFIGEPDADGLFRQEYDRLRQSGRAEVDFLMSGALQWLLNFAPIESVGGYPTRLATTHDGFRFLPDSFSVGPDLVHAVLEHNSKGSQLSFQTPPGVSSHGYELQIAVGAAPTIGAFACLIPQATTAWLICDGRPSQLNVIKTSEMPELIREAAARFEQVLTSPHS